MTRPDDESTEPSTARRLWSLFLGLSVLSLPLRAIGRRGAVADTASPAPSPPEGPGAIGSDVLDSQIPELAPLKLAAAPPSALRNGYIEALSNGQVTGWASPSGVPVSIVMDNAVVGTVTANLPRPDVQGAGYGPNTGWAF